MFGGTPTVRLKRTAGVASAGEIFDALDFLRALSSHVVLELRS